MNRKKLLTYLALVVIAAALFVRAASGGMDHPFKSGKAFGTWLAALLTLAIMSFLYDDNPFYRFAEHLFIGVSAAYWMVIGFWLVLVPNLFARLWPTLIKKHFIPDLSIEGYRNLWYLIPLILGIMLLMRLSDKAGWMSRWALAFVFGTTAGLRFVGFLVSDFIGQIQNTMVSVIVLNNGRFDWAALRASLSVVIGVFGVLTGLIYFFFSKEHKGLFGKASRVGIWILMITFGAGFGYTVMGRIALLVGRMEFLFRDWLHIVP
ncbi:MAG: hypothetical protein ACYTBJ_03550 [Planctomycetota bacterium]|jgi:hypothetical protein